MQHMVGMIIALLVLAGCVDRSAPQSPQQPQPSPQAETARGQVRYNPDELVRQIKAGYAESHALIIAQSRYNNGWEYLPGAQADATAVSAALKKHGFTIHRHDDLPDRRALREALDGFVDEYGQAANNRLVIYFAGHGATLSFEDGRQQGYLVPTSAPLSTDGGFTAKALEMSELRAVAERIQAKHVLFLLDSCFAGTIFETLRGQPPVVDYKTSEPVRQFITAGSADQQVPDRSRFRQLLVAALEGQTPLGAEGYITASALGAYLQTQIINATGQRQTPQIGKLDRPELAKGDVVFFMPQAADTTPPRLELPADLTTTEAEIELQGRAVDVGGLDRVEINGQPVRVDASGAFRVTLAVPGSGTVTLPIRARDKAGNVATGSVRLHRQAPQRIVVQMPQPVVDEPVITAQNQPVPTSPVSSVSSKIIPVVGVYPQTKSVFKDCSDCPEMVVVPAGSYDRGSPEGEEGRWSGEGPVRRVTIPRSFAVGRYEVSFAEWDACRADGGCGGYRPDDRWDRGKQPVIYVSWQDAQSYVTWLSRKTGERYRLLTEAEWEYMARAGTQTRYWWGNDISPSQANYGSRTVPVDSFAANPFGLYNVHGNVYEWVQDCYVAPYPKEPVDGTAVSGPESCPRVLRGGSWVSDPGLLRSAYRFGNSPDVRFTGVGFRLARMLSD